MLRERASDAKGNEFHGNGTAVDVADTPRPDSIFLDDSQAAPDVSGDEVEERRPEMVAEEGDIIQGVERERGAQAGRGRKRIVGALLAVVMLVLAVVVIWFMASNGATRKARVAVNAGGNSNSAQQTEEGMTRQAIQELNSGPGVTFGDGTVARPEPSPAGKQVVTQSVSNEPVTQLPATVNPNLSSTVDSARSTNSSTQASDANSQSSSVSKVVSGTERNNERSVRIGEELVAPVKREAANPERAKGEENSIGAVALPSFGSMLPVRSLGVIYTLRSGGLVRFELTRDVKGKGWLLPHGTVLVGALRGSEYDRAFISLIGFIDSESGSFVKISGDVLGSDGGTGVRGKRRKMSSGWSRVLGKLGEASLSIAGSLASSVGRRPVIITDAFGGAGSRVTSEFDGVLLSRDRNVFLEVAAGTACYVMITELPEAIQGVDALAKFSGRDVESRADSDQRRDATGISEHELAELIQSGDSERIKLALPRMTPEMRRVAESVMGQGGDR
jgi:type II secretory pathway pseudopilin PulG